MAVLSNAHHRDRAVGVVNLDERPGGTSGHRAAVRGVGREEGDSDFDDDIVRFTDPSGSVVIAVGTIPKSCSKNGKPQMALVCA